MKTKKFRAECDLAGVIMHFRALDKDDAWDTVLKHPEYRRAHRKHKATKDDWKIIEE